MRLFISFVMLLSMLGCSSLTRENEEKSKLLLKIGASQLEAGEYPTALKTLLEAERLNPKNAMIQNNLGLAYLMRDRPDHAEKHLRLSIELDPNYTEAKNNLGKVLSDMGKHKEAVQILQFALKDLTYVQPAKTTLNLGITYFRMQDFSKAKEFLQKTLTYGRDNCVAQNYLGRTFFETKDYKAAAQILDRAVGFCKTNQFDEPHYYSALAYYQLGNQAKAEALLEEVMRQYPRGSYQDKAKSLLETMRK